MVAICPKRAARRIQPYFNTVCDLLIVVGTVKAFDWAFDLQTNVLSIIAIYTLLQVNRALCRIADQRESR